MPNFEKMGIVPSYIVEALSLKHRSEVKTTSQIIVEGHRNNTIFGRAGKLFNIGLSFEEVHCLCEHFNDTRCSPPLDPGEVFNIVSSAQSKKCETPDIEITPLGYFFVDENFKDPVPIIMGLLHKGEFHIMSAPAKAHKTAMQLNLAISIARGDKFLDYFSCFPCKILIVQTEIGNAQLKTRLQKIAGDDITGIEDQILFINTRIKIDTPRGINLLSDLIDEHSIQLLILDPLYTLHNKNEDSSSEMAPLLSNLREIAIKKDIAILLIHHQGKRTEGMGQTGHRHRGSSSFADAPDGSWSIKRTDDKKISNLSFEMRNIEAPGPFKFSIDDNLRMKILGKADDDKQGISSNDIADYVKEFPGLTSKELVAGLCEQFGSCERTIRERIKLAVMTQRIYQKTEGTSKKHFLCTTTAKLQPSNETPLPRF